MKILVYPLLSATLFAGTAAAQPGGDSAPVPVIVAPVRTEPLADRTEGLGTTRANETVTLTANVTETVREIRFDDGQQVSQGEILVILDKAEEEADLKSARALRDERRAAYERARTLRAQNAISASDLDEREALLHQAEGQIEAIQSRIADRVIRAPFDGVLGLRHISPGALVQPGDEITTMDDLSRIKVDFDVPSVFLRDLGPGLPVEGAVAAFGDEVFSGTVSSVDTRVDPATRTVTVRAVLPNPDARLKTGLLMNIELLRNARTALMAPEGALIQRGRKFFVLAATERDGKTIVEQKPIVTGTRVPGKVEVVSGLDAGDRVVVHGLMQARPGQEVVIRAVAGEDRSLADLLQEENASAQGG